MDQAATIAWYKSEIDHLRQAIGLMEGGVLTTGEAWEGDRIEGSTAQVLPQYKTLLADLEAALALIEAT